MENVAELVKNKNWKN